MLIRSDLHVHTHLSLCANATATAEAYIENARTLGIKKLGIADHMWDDEHVPYDVEGDEYSDRCKQWGRGYKKQNYTYTLQSRPEFAAAEHDGIEILFGCECEYDYKRRNIAISEEVAKKLDFLIVPNSHTHLTMPERFFEPKELHIKFMTDAFMDIVTSPLAKYVTSVAHPFEAVCCPYDKAILIDMMSDEEFKKCFAAARNNNIAIEVNLSNYSKLSTESEYAASPTTRMMKLAKDVGCKFTFGTDTHSKAEQLALFPKADIIAKVIGITENDLADIAK